MIQLLKFTLVIAKKIYNDFQAVIVSLFLSNKKYNINNIDITKIAVVGNGPSLKEDLVKISNRNDIEFFCVNHFVDSEYFEKLKPRFYSFSDPYFWDPYANEYFVKKREKSFLELNEKVSWPIVVYVPVNANLEYLNKKISNRNIEIRKFNSGSYPYISASKIVFKLFDMSRLSPFGINVIIHALFISISLGAKEIELYGADTSFHTLLRVDQKNNDLYREATHFYGKVNEILYKDVGKTTKAKMSDELGFILHAFLNYELVEEYAKYKKVNIINASSFSWIDAFKRS